MSLYDEGHPSRERAVDAVWTALMRLQEVEPEPAFTLLDGEILMASRPIRELRGWEWGSRFSNAGIQRLEILGAVTREDLEVFLEETLGRVSGEPVSSAEARHSRPTNIRFGLVGLEQDGEVTAAGAGSEITTATLGYDLQDEVRTVEWIHDELRGRNRLNLLEAEAIVRSLTVAMHGDQEFLIPLLRLKEFDQYTTTHAMNVSVLAMALSEYIGLDPGDIRSFGISGLLHDLGKVSIPEEILNKPGKLTDAEREVMNGHTVEGARIILETEEHLDLAAVVAYEHHIKIDGGGYPRMRYPRRCHQASDLVHICDVFDALRTKRPYRDAWPEEKVLNYLSEGAGREFDEDLTRAFVRMIRTWSHRLAYLERPDAPLRPSGPEHAQGALPSGGSPGDQVGGEPAVAGADAGPAEGGSGEASGRDGENDSAAPDGGSSGG
jgi:putative nucleotidyltransferase with HDIG domain